MRERRADAAAVDVDFLAVLPAGKDDTLTEGITAMVIDQSDLQQLVERTTPGSEMTP